MKKEKMLLVIKVIAVMGLIELCGSCASNKYTSFSRGQPGWTDILVSEKVSQTVILNKCVEIITRKGYEPEMISKDTGYLRTKWKEVKTIKKTGFFGTSKIEVSEYRLQIIIQVSADSEKVGIKCVAEKLEKGEWVEGCDSEELKDISDSIRGSVAGY